MFIMFPGNASSKLTWMVNGDLYCHHYLLALTRIYSNSTQATRVGLYNKLLRRLQEKDMKYSTNDTTSA